MQIKKYFADHFRICEAITTEQKNETYRVRHKVYCEEFAYEPLAPDGLEKDQFDIQSYHCLVEDVEGGHHIGSMRLIQGDERYHGGSLPVFSQCAEAFDKRLFNVDDYAPHQLGEVSRLAVVNSHRMRNADRRKVGGSNDVDNEHNGRTHHHCTAQLIVATHLLIDIESDRFVLSFFNRMPLN